MPIRSSNPQGEKEWEKAPSSFHSLRQFLVSGLLFVLLVGVSLVNAPAAYAGSRRKRDPRASNGIAQFVPRTRNVPAVFAVPETTKIDWEELHRAVRGLLPTPHNPNPTPVARDSALPALQPIDRSLNDQEKWTGNLSQENLQRQSEQVRVLGEQGEELRYRLFQLKPNHHFLTAETYKTLSGQNIKYSIWDDKTRYRHLKRSLEGAAPVEPHFQVRESTLERYRDWRTCADIFSTAIEEFRTQR